jgi:sugar-specific transcriptional regulator TrmB
LGPAGLESRLRSLLGLSGYEARAYLALLRLGEASPREVAEEAGVPTQRIYDVLRRLSRRGLVSRVGEGRFRAVDPERALKAEAERLLFDTLRRREELELLARELADLAAPGSGEEVLLIHGLEQALAWAASAAESCGERPVFAAYKVVERLRDLWPLLLGLIERLPRGALVLVSRGAPIPGELAEEARRRGIEVREEPCVTMDLMVACDTVVIGLPGPGGGVVGVVVRSREFADALLEGLTGRGS